MSWKPLTDEEKGAIWFFGLLALVFFGITCLGGWVGFVYLGIGSVVIAIGVALPDQASTKVAAGSSKPASTSSNPGPSSPRSSRHREEIDEEEDWNDDEDEADEDVEPFVDDDEPLGERLGRGGYMLSLDEEIEEDDKLKEKEWDDMDALDYERLWFHPDEDDDDS